MKNILEQNGIDFEAKSKYNTLCPKCSQERNKSDQKCLQVYIEDKAVIWQCFHGDCEWKERQVHFMSRSIPKIEHIDNQTVLWNENGIWDERLKESFEKAIKYPYYNKDEQLWFYIIRNGNKQDKVIRPVSLDTKNTYQMIRPQGPYMPYRIEHFDPSKPTLIVEGEKAADYAAKIAKKSNVLSWVGGSNCVKDTDWSMLKGNEVTLWPDNDLAGSKAIDEFVEILLSTAIPSKIYRIVPDELPEHFDIADIAEVDLIKRLFENKVEIELDETSDHQYTLDRLNEEFKKKEDYISFGFPEVDKWVQIPEPGLTVFTARTNHGKTHALIATAVNLLKNVDRTILYVSYEESGKKVAKRFLKCLDGLNNKDAEFESHFLYEERLNKEFEEDSSETVREFKNYITSNKLRLYDVNTPVKEIVVIMKRLKALGKQAVVFLDYAQRIPDLSDGARYLNIQKQMEQFVDLANTNGQAIITAAQVTINKENAEAEGTRESVAIEHSADLRIGVWNKESGRSHGTNLYKDQPGEIIWIVKKSRQNKANGKIFSFDTKNGCDLQQSAVQLSNEGDKY